ncbi:MAG: GDSL-type esterase/lipase family protein [Verrucomicrobiota bacterium]
MSAANAKPGKGCLVKIFLLLVSTGIALALAEIGTRIVFADKVVLFPRFHTDAQYGPYHLRRLLPSTTFRHTDIDGSWLFKTNAQGFRDTRDYPYEKDPGVLRVLCLGDSQTEGFEVNQENAFPKIIERKLAQLGRKAEVMNTGISGFGTAEELAFLENEGLKYKPDVVVLGWYANDPDDNVKSGMFAVENGQLVPRKYEHVPGVSILNAINRIPPLRWASEHSWFYSLLFNHIWDLKKELLSKKSAAETAEFTARAPSQDKTTVNYQNELSAKLIERLRETCAKAGARLVILDIPLFKTAADFETSVPPELTDTFKAGPDIYPK